MKRIVCTIALLIPLALTGCSSKAGTASLGAVGGAAAGGGVYEYRLNEARQRIESDYKAGKMDEKEYKARLDEVQRLQLFR